MASRQRAFVHSSPLPLVQPINAQRPTGHSRMASNTRSRLRSECIASSGQMVASLTPSRHSSLLPVLSRLGGVIQHSRLQSTLTATTTTPTTPLKEIDHRQRLSQDQVSHDANKPSSSSIDAQVIQQGPIELSREQQFLVRQVIEKKKSVFFTGSAGTGKSVLLRQLIEELKVHYLPGNVAVTASTGIAACNIGGITLHSFAGVGLGKGTVDQLATKVLENKRARARWRKTKVLIIDEISMIPGDFFDKLEEIARRVKKSNKPFGGIQLIITGDFFQLPPVTTDAVLAPIQQQQQQHHQHQQQPNQQQQHQHHSTSPSLPVPSVTQRRTRTVISAKDLSAMDENFDEFNDFPEMPDGIDGLPESNPFGIDGSLDLPTMKEEKVNVSDADAFSNDPFEWDAFSNESNKSSDPQSVSPSLPSATSLPPMMVEEPKLCFESRAWKECIDYMLQLTEVFRQRDPQFIKMLTEMRHGKLSEETCRIFKTLRRKPDYPDDGIRATELYALRRQVDAANHRYLAELPGPLYIYEPQDSGPLAALMDKFSIAPSVLQLKENAQVMLIKNLSPTLVNGSMGVVVGFQRDVTYAENGALVESHFPIVRFPTEEVDYVVRPEEWRMEMPNGDVIASRIQVPLILAWAISIHKSQGQTMQRVKVDMGKIFEAGQAYVALSRATSLAGLQVLNFDRRAVEADERVAQFYEGLETVRSLMDREAAREESRLKRRLKRTRSKNRAPAAVMAEESSDNSTITNTPHLREGASLRLETITGPVSAVTAEHGENQVQLLEQEKQGWLKEVKSQWAKEHERRQARPQQEGQAPQQGLEDHAIGAAAAEPTPLGSNLSAEDQTRREEVEMNAQPSIDAAATVSQGAELVSTGATTTTTTDITTPDTQPLSPIKVPAATTVKVSSGATPKQRPTTLKHRSWNKVVTIIKLNEKRKDA